MTAGNILMVLYMIMSGGTGGNSTMGWTSGNVRFTHSLCLWGSASLRRISASPAIVSAKAWASVSIAHRQSSPWARGAIFDSYDAGRQPAAGRPRTFPSGKIDDHPVTFDGIIRVADKEHVSRWVILNRDCPSLGCLTCHERCCSRRHRLFSYRALRPVSSDCLHA